MNFMIRIPKKITINDVQDEHNITKSTSKQRLANKLVKKHIISYVLNVIPVKSTNPKKLDKFCLLNSNISEIECLFQMKENNYRSLITLLFGSDNFIKEIIEALVFHHPISTQECMISVNFEKCLRKI